MNLPKEFWRAKVQQVSASVQPAVERYLLRIREMVAKGAGLLICGDSGVGKTSVAALIAKESRARGYVTFFVGIWELREAIRSRVMFDDGVSILDRCREVDVLILDGLREDDAKELYLGERTLEELISYRKARHRVTIVTTCMSMRDISAALPGFYNATVGALVPLLIAGENKKIRAHEDLVKEILGV